MDLPFANLRGANGRDADKEARILRDRAAARDARRDNASSRRTSSGAARKLVQVFEETSLPTEPNRFVATHPVELDCPEREGADCTPTADTDTTIYVAMLNSTAAVGDMLVAVHTGGKWFAEKGKAKPPPCRFVCGPFVTISGTGAGALATCTVGDDGTISDVTLLSGGHGYDATPTVTIAPPTSPPIGSGGALATVSATVGPVVQLTITDGGTGYTSAPTVTIAAPGGSGTTATATATIDPDTGKVTGLTITSGGSLYTEDPAVTLSGGGGSGATATATARPGVITKLTLTNPGAGFVDNTPPDRLDLTISCPAWSVSMTLSKGFDPGGTQQHRDDAPPGTLPFCYFGGQKAVDFPGLPGRTVKSLAAHTEFFGWCLQVDIDALFDEGQPFDCPGACNNPSGAGGEFLWRLVPSLPPPASPGPGLDNGGPLGPIVLSCSSRPWSSSQTISTFPFRGGCASSQDAAWYVLAGGTCSGTAGDQPGIDYTLTLSEPTDDPAPAPMMATAGRPSVDESARLIKMAKQCPFASREGCCGIRCALSGKVGAMTTCMACVRKYGP